MNATPRLPPLDPLKYEWKPSHSHEQWHRRALAGETLWISRPKDQHEMFIGGSLTLNSLISSSAITSAARSAWRRLRFEVPELVVSAAYGKAGNAYMQYVVPSSDEEVDSWVERTTSFQCRETSLDFRELLVHVRQEKGKEKDGHRHDSEQAFLLFHPVVTATGSEGLVHSVDFVLNADHQITDGIGIRILLGRFLALLAEALGSTQAMQEELDWQQSFSNLAPPWTSLVNDEQLLSGPEYERAAEANEEVLLRKMPQNPGLPFQPTPKPPTQETHFITLTKTQSVHVLESIKQVISPESNITHLGHAAMVLALLRSIPPPLPPPSHHSRSQTFYSPCFLNGRRYLKPARRDINQPDATKSYIPICQSFAPIIFPDLQSLALSESASRDQVRRLLVRACKVATAEYGRIKERKSVLPECAALFERLGKNMYLRQQEPSSQNAAPVPNPPSPPPGDLNVDIDPSHQPNDRLPNTPINNAEHDSSPSSAADPIFLSDGITEQYIDHSYFSPSHRGETHPQQQKRFTVNDLTFAANAEKNLVVRMSCWRGRVGVSGEWRGCDYDGAVMVRFLEDMVGIMLSIIE